MKNFQGLIILLSKTFHALQNTKVPAVTSIVSEVLNIALSLWFVALLGFSGIFKEVISRWFHVDGLFDIRVVGLPLADSLSGLLQFLILLFILHSYLGKGVFKEIAFSFQKIVIASAVAGLAVYGLIDSIPVLFHLNIQAIAGIFLQTLIAGAGGILIYLACSLILQSPEIAIIMSSIQEQFKK